MWRRRRTSLRSMAVIKSSGSCYCLPSYNHLEKLPWNSAFFLVPEIKLPDKAQHGKKRTANVIKKKMCFLLPLMPVWLRVASFPLWAASPVGEMTGSPRLFTDLISRALSLSQPLFIEIIWDKIFGELVWDCPLGKDSGRWGGDLTRDIAP